MFLCVKCILVNKIAANLKCSVYNFSLIPPYQLYFFFFFVKKCSPADLKRRREILGANGLFDYCSGSCLRVIPNVFATGTPGWPRQLCFALCPVTGRRDKCQRYLEGKAWVSVRTCSVFSSVTVE